MTLSQTQIILSSSIHPSKDSFCQMPLWIEYQLKHICWLLGPFNYLTKVVQRLRILLEPYGAPNVLLIRWLIKKIRRNWFDC